MVYSTLKTVKVFLFVAFLRVITLHPDTYVDLFTYFSRRQSKIFYHVFKCNEPLGNDQFVHSFINRHTSSCCSPLYMM